MEALRQKSLLLTGYLELLIRNWLTEDAPQRSTEAYCSIITPTDPEQRGCQLCLQFSIDVNTVLLELQKRGVVVSTCTLLLILLGITYVV